MEKVLRITSVKAKENDFVFWQSKNALERLEAIEFLRQQYFSLTNNVQPRLQRICRITQQK